jgi:hypothetical protein
MFCAHDDFIARDDGAPRRKDDRTGLWHVGYTTNRESVCVGCDIIYACTSRACARDGIVSRSSVECVNNVRTKVHGRHLMNVINPTSTSIATIRPKHSHSYSISRLLLRESARSVYLRDYRTFRRRRSRRVCRAAAPLSASQLCPSYTRYTSSIVCKSPVCCALYDAA